MAKKLNYVSVDKQLIIHTLFGGFKSAPESCDIFEVRLRNMNNSYACNLKAMNKDVICENIPCIQSAPWLNELKSKNIVISDIDCLDKPIDILIGANVAGKLMTGKQYKLENGLTAIETFLGWTIMGELSNTIEKNNLALPVTSMIVKQADITDLWNLDILGITDPENKKSEAEKNAEVQQKFIETVKINEEGRYEVELPWIVDHSPLPSNLGIAKKRLESTVRKLKNENLYDAYDDVFSNWLQEGIIERVPDDEIDHYGHYLPHRHVLKENSSTRLRPVFDASAREKNFPSLNQCLQKGPNLIELIPTILLRFRRRQIGVCADIKKAFLQISVCAKDRNYLRFLWYDKDKLQVFRHKRVVFGVSCSPFLLGATL